MALVLDTGPILGYLDATDGAHARCRALIDHATELLVIPSPVLVELDYWIGERLHQGVLLRLLEDVITGAFAVVDLLPGDYHRVHDLCTQYSDSDIGFVDAAVLTIVERLNEPKLATLDRRHFAMMRPRHVDHLTLVPE